MIKQLPLLLLFGFLWSQDTLITKKGVIYSGKIISSTEKYVDFLPSSFKYSTKVSKDEIKELINNSGGNEISLDSKSVSDKTYSLPNSPVIGKIKQESNLTSSNSYDFSKTGKVLVGMGGLLIVSCNLESSEDITEKTIKNTLDENHKHTDSLRIRYLMGGLLIAVGSFIQII